MAAPSKKSRAKRSKEERPKLNEASKKTFKAKKVPDAAARSQAVALQLEDDDPEFPRGGGSSLSRKERDEIHAEVDAEFKSKEQAQKWGKRKKLQRRGQETSSDLGSLFNQTLTGKLPKYVNKITLKNICPGMKLWGVVVEVNEKDLVVGLPGGLRGLVRASDALDSSIEDEIQKQANEGAHLTTIFHVGQLVSCVVLQLDDDTKESSKRKIWLSLCLSLLHKSFTLDSFQEGMVIVGNVKSIEDHGYILHLGSSPVMAFLPMSSRPEGKEVVVRTGQLLQGVVTRVDKDRRVVYLSSEQDFISKCVTKDIRSFSIDLLVPGMMVNAFVRSVLENGIMLSFLTFFTGTVDMFHLQNPFSAKIWKEQYLQNKKVNARILFIDPSTRAVGLTMNPHLLLNEAPPLHAKIGDIYDPSKVVRVDRGMGLLLDLPSEPASTPAYVNISDIGEKDASKLDKKYKEGNKLRVRVIGFRHLEGLATGTLKANVIEGAVFTHSDVKAGMVLRAKVIAVDSFGAIVQFPGGVKALCPVTHMSEFEIAKPGKKFKVGAELVFRVLGCKSKRITVTHKKTLVKSKLPIISSYADAIDGLITHGWITKIEKHGCFVRFYSGVQGFAPRYELGLDPGDDPSSMYHAGQVVKCRVTSSVPASRRINLSFLMKPARISDDDGVKVGNVVAGVVESVTPDAVIVHVNGKAHLKGTISTEHLADHQGQAALLKSLLKPGYEFNQLLILDIEGNSLLLSAKHCLITFSERLPSELNQMHPSSVVYGYICNIIESGCFVRFLGHLTGFSPRSKALDDQKADLSQAFYVGQSVRSSILDVNNVLGRVTLLLRQTSCPSTDASFLHDFFTIEDKIAKLQLPDPVGSEMDWVEGFPIGSIVEGKVKEAKDIGVVVCFDKYNDVIGFIAHYQLGGNNAENGSVVRAAVLDVAKAERLIDMSLKPQFVIKAKEQSKGEARKKRKRDLSRDLEVNQTVNAIVEIVKEREGYLVLSIPECHNTIGYASITDFNTQKSPQKQFSNGQSVIATVMELPSLSTFGRLLLLLKSIGEANETSSSKRARKKSGYGVGSLVQAEITEIKLLEMRLKFGIGLRGRVHITEVNDSCILENPFGDFRIGQTVSARIVARSNQSDTRKGEFWDLSVRPTVFQGADGVGINVKVNEFDFSIGQHVTGYVYKVDMEWAWLTVSRNVSARFFILDSSPEPSELQDFQKRFAIGKAISGYILSINKEKRLLRMLRQPLGDLANDCADTKTDASNPFVPDANVIAYVHEGDILGGRISKILPGVGGLLVQIGPSIHGRVHFTELKDDWVPDPLSGYSEGQFVRCKVLEIRRSIQGSTQVDLSLRSSPDGMFPQDSYKANNFGNTCRDGSIKRIEKVEDVTLNMAVQGYVKNIGPKGCFIVLSRTLDAKILLSNLSDGYVDKPEDEFPIRKLVTGRVLSVEPLSRRVEVTLRTTDASADSKSAVHDFSTLHVGDVVTGKIKRIEPYGLFIAVDHSNLVGLCHVSEISDDHVENLETKYKAGEKVMAKIVRLDEERHRISLGLKKSYFVENVDGGVSSDEDSIEVSGETGFNNGGEFPPSTSESFEQPDIDSRNAAVALAQAESRSSIPPLEVSLSAFEPSRTDNLISQNESLGDVDTVDEKNKRKAKKIAKEREQEIRAAEARILEKDAPKTADEFEKLVRSSPNSSFVWIKYMAFMLSLADVEKARAIAERALRTISIREENEKLNVWVAYFNLENKYGDPPEVAVQKLFKRALQYCEPKKVYLALLGMYERNEQLKLADELLQKMVKKFKHSCKVWLKRVQLLLKQEEDKVQSIVNRALLCLPRHKHIKFISQAAILEFKCGVPDRGRSLFEGILREYPKRTDLWSVYLDQEIRLGEVGMIRSLFERAVSLSLQPKKMKFLFKKYLEFEKSIGDEERIESVKQKAMEYVESTLA